MKLKKIFSVFPSLALLFCCASLPAFAEENTYQKEFIIIGVAENSYYAVGDAKCFISQEDIDKFSLSHEKLECGDIILLDNVKSTKKDAEYTSQLYIDTAIDESRPASIYKIGSVLDNPETKQFTITYLWAKSPVTSFTNGFTLEDNDGNSRFYKTDWFGYGTYQLPDIAIDLSSLQVGDKVTCITYKDEPIFITEKLLAIPNGDADQSGSLDILDVITVNKVIMGKEELDPEIIPYIDFNGNGVPDSDDALTMLKKIVGLS